MPASVAAAEPSLQKILCGKDIVAVFQIVVFAFDQLLRVAHDRLAKLKGCTSGVSTRAPSLKLKCLPEIAGTRSPGTMIPARFSGSAAEIVMVSPLGCMFFIARRDSTAI